MLRVVTFILLFFTHSGLLAEEDNRIGVAFSEPLKQQLMSNMRDHMVALSEILGHMAYDDLNQAAEVAEKQLGLSAKHAHGTAKLGKYMPPEMRQAGYNMHSAASYFAKVAKTGDAESAYEALAELSVTCVECHAAYKLK
jgi:hypothetical protein